MSELDIDVLEKLGKLTRVIRKEVSVLPKVGMDITQIIDYIERRIFEEGYMPAFPATVSVNDVAAHYTVFDEGYLLKRGDLIKIDFGISQDGFMTDNAFTVEIETNEYKDLMKANLEGLNAVMDKAEIGVTMNELGETVHGVAKKYGYETIHNLCGHQIARNNLHSGMSVPNFANRNSMKIEDDMQLAIEPFFTKGSPKVKSCGPSNVTHLKGSKPVRDPVAKKVLGYIEENYTYLPFSKRWLVEDVIRKLNPSAPKGFDIRKVKYALKVLKAHGIIHEYDALSTVDGSMVSQYEDCVVFVNNKKSVITRL